MTGPVAVSLFEVSVSGGLIKGSGSYAATLGVTIDLEPINQFETFLVNTCEQALSPKQMIGEPNVCVHLDTFHMNMEEKNLKNTILLANKDLGIHLNENDWGIPGTGHMDWDGIFQGLREINYEGYASLQCVAELRGGYVWRQLARDNQP